LTLKILSTSMRLLFITSNRIGDAVLSTGVLNHFLQAYPDIKVTIAAGPLATPLFEDAPGVVDLVPFRKEPYSLHWFKLWRRVITKPWDICVDLRGSLITYGIWAKKRYVWRSTSDESNLKLHKVESLGKLLGLEVPPAPQLWVSKEKLELARKQLCASARPLIGLGIGSNWRGKQWRVEHFIDLAKRLSDETGPFPRARFLLVGAPSERLMIAPFIEAFPQDQVLDYIGSGTLIDVAAYLKQCNFFIGNDSGLMHMAAAVGTPTLGLFGPSHPEHYRPWGPQGHFIRTLLKYEELVGTPGYNTKTVDTLMDSLTVSDVYDRVKSLFPIEKVLHD
jgi:heptosyltransferase-3